jgi:hypothetical protein
MTILLNYFYRADFVVAKYESGAVSTKTYSFVNKLLKDSTSIATYWPLLRSVGEVSLRAGETLPEVSLSSIEISNAIGSFGADRKFGDVLQRYSPIEQTVIVYVAEESTSADTVSSWVEWGRGVVSDFEASSAGEDPTLVFNIRPLRYSESVCTLEVTRSMVGMANAPDSSLGRAVPLLLGSDLDVIPVRISADSATTVRYAVGTCFYQHLTNRTASAEVYSKNLLDEWERALSNFTSTYAATYTGEYTLNTYAGRAFGVPNNPSGIVHGIKLKCKGKGLASSIARIGVFLLRYDNDTKQIIEEVTKGSADLSVYNATNAASTDPLDLRIAFDRAVFISAEEKYAIGWDVSGYQVGDMVMTYTNTSSVDGFIRDSGDTASSSGFAWKYIAGGVAPNNGNLRYEFLEYEPTWQDMENTYSQSGLSYTSLYLTGQSVDSGQVTPPLDNFPILVGNIDGLTTYGGSTVVERPQTIAELLNYKWAIAGGWTDQSYWDTSTLNASHYEYLYSGATPTLRSRVVQAVFESKVTFSQVLSEVCRGTASRVGILSNGKSFLYPFGRTVDPAADIPPADIISTLAWVTGDISTVVNRAVIKTGRSYLAAPKVFEGQDVLGYQYVTDYSATNETPVAALTAKSRALYDIQELENGEFFVRPRPSGGSGTYLCNSSTDRDGSILAEYVLARFGSPITVCSFIVPYSRYRTLKMFDIITFTSPNFPAFYGTDPNARDGVVDVGGSVTSVSGADYGYETVRAQTYRGQIEGITNIAAMEHSPAIKLDVLVLLNFPLDPT